MKTSHEKIHYKWFIIGILTATLWLTVSANYDDYPTECPKVDPVNYTVLLPHETDCEKYYACSNGRKILMHCPFMDHEGNRLHFSPKLHVCDFPNHAGCTAHTTTTEQTSAPTETTTSTPPSTTTTSAPETTTSSPPSTTTTSTAPPTTTAPTSPPPEPTTTTEPPATTTESTTASNVVSTSNPSTTTIVSSTTGQPTSPGGTSTNEPSITTTELPSASTTLSTGNPTTTTVEASTTAETTVSTESSTSEPPITTTEQTTPTASTPLPSNPTSDVTSSSTSEVTTTPELPSTSSESSSSTTSDIIVTTTEQIETTTIAPSIHLLCTESTSGVFLPHESHSNLYYECNYGNLVRRKCDDSLVFDVTDQTCVWPSDKNYSEELTDVPPTDNPSNSSDVVTLCISNDSSSHCGRYPHECECNKFYVCINGDAVLRICPSSLNFNPTLKECDLPENVECSGGGGGINPNTTIPTECPPDNTGWAVHLAHESNCTLFYKCNWGEKVVLPCRPGLHFNPKLQVCDWPCQAGCTAEGGDGINWCHSPKNPDSETPVEEKSNLRFSLFRRVEPINNIYDDES